VRKHLPIPINNIPTENRQDSRPIIFGYSKYSDMFNDRQLLGLGVILKEISQVADENIREYLLLAFSDSLASNNMLASYAFGYRKLTPLFGIHSYRRVTRPVEGNVLGTSRGRGSYMSCARKLVKGKRYADEPWEYDYHKGEPRRVLVGESSQSKANGQPASTRPNQDHRVALINSDARSMDWLDDHSVDIVLTDPPYYDNISYSELSDFYYVWIRDFVRWPSKMVGIHTPMSRSLVVNGRNSEHHDDFIVGLSSAFGECRRVLKEDGIMIFTYHHKRARAWAAMTQSLSAADFRVTNVFPVLSEGKSGFHSSHGSLKWDIVFVCRAGGERRLPRFQTDDASRWVKSEFRRWMLRLRSSGYRIGTADQESLGFGLIAAYMTSQSTSAIEMVSVLDELSKATVKRG
jgi:adenine-specific DNA methylase